MSALAKERSPAAARYLAALLDGDPLAAGGVVAGLRREGTSAAEVVAGIIAPALHEIGRLWQARAISVADEHMASEITAVVVGEHLPFVGSSGGAACAVVACPGAETHALAARALAGLLREQGWDVIHLGGATPPAGLVALAAARRPALVALSVKLAASLPAATEASRRLRALESPPVLLVGGAATRGREPSIPADLVLDDVAAAMAWTASLHSKFADKGASI